MSLEIEFTPDKSHHDNVKTSVDKILNTKTSVKRIRKNKEDREKETFISIIESIVALEERNIILHGEFDVDLVKFCEPYQVIIDSFFELHFSRPQNELINFFLYDRYSADGEVLQPMNEHGDIMELNTPADLWNLLKTMK